MEKDNLGCSVGAFVKPEQSGNSEAFVRKQTRYGNHLVWVYGDYSEPMRELGALMGLEVDVVT